MRIHILSAALMTALLASPARAQTPGDTLAPLQIAANCAIPPDVAPTKPFRGPHVVGSQDAGFKTLASAGDVLVIDSGLQAGLEVNQRFFVRRPVTLGGPVAGSLHAISTLAWVHVIAVNDIMALAVVDHACNAIQQGDYLEPFVAPILPEGFDKTDVSGELDFTYEGLGRVLFGQEDQITAAPGDFMLVDRGSDRGVRLGARFAVYRDAVNIRDAVHAVRPPGFPLAAIGEVVVISASKGFAVVRITTARDRVQQGDYLVPRRP